MAVKCLKEGAPSPPIYTRLCGWLVMEWVLGEGGVNPIAHGTHLPIYMLWRFVECSPTHMRFIKSISGKWLRHTSLRGAVLSELV